MDEPDLNQPRVAMFMPGLRPESLGWFVHLDLSRQIENAGIHFEVLTTGPSTPARSRGGRVRVLPPATGWSAIAKFAAPVLRTRSLLPSVAALTRFLRAEGDRIDLLHVEVAYPHGVAVVLARRLSRWDGPVVMTPMGEDTLVVEDASYGYCRFRAPRALVTWGLRHADVIRCISPLHERRIAELAPARPRVVVPLNVSAAAAQAAVESASDRERRRREARRQVDAHCGTAGRPVVLALGRLHPFKGLDVLVRAMAHVPDAMLVLVGPSLRVRRHGDVAPMLLNLAASLGIGDRVQWVGPTPPDRSLEWLAGVDVVAVPSHLESLNKVCVEAAAVGTPFVVTETTGISAWVADRNDGIGHVVPPRDPRALAEALADVTSARWVPDRSALAAFAQRFRPAVIADALAGVYRQALAGQGRWST